MSSLTSAKVTNKFSLNGDVKRGVDGETFTFTDVNSTSDVTLEGSYNLNINKQAWYYEKPKQNATEWQNGKHYWVIEVNGSDEEDNTKPGSSEDKPDTKPGASENKPNTKPGTSEKKPETKPASGSTVKKTIKTKSLKVKKTKVTLKKGKKYKIQAKKIPASSTAKIMYRSSNKRIAKVTKKGVIKALKKGKCKITVKTSDGKKKVIIVKVK